jgi:branched-chain amino acid transport system substrate-binding protein
VGVQPTVQWTSQQVPLAMLGISSQATNSTFWKDTNGATQGVLFQAISSPDVAVSPKTIPFAEGFKKRFGNYPSYAGYTAYDEVYYLVDAIKRAGGTDSDKMVSALEKTDWIGTVGRVQFYGKDEPFTHSLRYGKDLSGLVMQWQDGKQVTVWPTQLATGKVTFPSFVKVSSAK